MRSSWALLVHLCLLLSILRSSQSQRHDFLDSLHSHHHSESDLDAVQCHNAVYKINEKNGKPELVNGEESRADPSRQYLPSPGKYLPPESPQKSATPPKSEEDPAASFDQPNFLSVEKTLLSPSLQKNYQSLFVKNSNPDPPTAAQNVAPNILIPPAPRKTSSNKDSEDDKYSLDRLCKDAFHSFLCKPIKGPRKTPNGRIRPNAVLPPDVLAGLSSFQDITKVRPDPSPLPSTTKYPPFQQSPTNQNQQRLPFPTPVTRKQVFPTAPTKSPTTKPYIKPDIPDFPSPTNNNPQILKPQQSENIPLNTADQTNGYVYQKPLIPFPPPVSSPSDQNSQLIYQRPIIPSTTFQPTTPKPTTTLGYSYDKPNIPFSSNNVLQIASPPQSKNLPSHDCENHKSANVPVEANPSNDNPSFFKPYNQVASKPLFLPKQPTEKPVYPLSSNEFPRVSLFPQTTTNRPYYTTTEECDKHKSPYPSLFGSSTNENRVFSKPEINKPVFPQPSNNFVSFSSLPSTTTAATEDCDKHKENANNPIFGNPTNQNPTFLKPSSDKPISPFPTKPFPRYYEPQKQTEPKPKEDCDKHKPSFQPDFANPTNQHSVFVKPFNPRIQPQLPKLPASSNNIAQILAEPEQVQSVTASPNTEKGYFYDKPAIPFPPPEGYPSEGDPNVIGIPTKKPFTFPTTTEKQNGYIYEQPRIPFASDSIEQILPQPTKSTPKSPLTTKVPCEHDKPFSPSQQFLGNPSNQDSVTLRPSNLYGGPKTYSESARPSSQFPSGFTPFVPSTTKTNNGYSYNKSPSTTNNAPSFASNGYSFQTTRKPYPSPFKQFSTTSKPLSGYPYYQQSELSLDAKPQNQVEVAVRPGYSYYKPGNPLEPSATNDGYSYPRPANPFIR